MAEVGNPGNLALLVIFEAIPVRCLCVSFLSVTCDFLCIFYFNPWQEDHRVTLNVYDLSQGLARQLSSSLLGKAIEAIWHTGVVVYGNEYYFGGGIQHAPAGFTPYGTPIRVIELGVTHVPKDVFEMYLQEISPRYTAETYSLLTHNCNNFSNEVAQFLVGASIPDYILRLPDEVMGSPMGALILPMIQNLETTMRSGAVPQVPQFRPTSTINVNGRDKKVMSEEKSTKSERPKASEQQKAAVNDVSGDPMGNARTKVQEEITKEFAAIMATGTLRASEAAALATKRVMQRYGNLSSAMSQS
ncbi:Desumoylating isopeptidase 1 [Morella rubra]|uniref:Desumoylating isopeptidase 1 n=1 Tax=Morella rubra TaxID=262757 RepID=A0A6A1VGF3_9ROSI|nr:Desumoylating isopeptidase 1 [Morella rubra]KAB1210160.1 Desumoylating isopeptidase 1 [Morella rubra]